MHRASYEFLMKPKESAGCHQTLSARVGSGDETSHSQSTTTKRRVATTMTESSFLVDTMVRGYHVYKDIWTAAVGEELTCRREKFNAADPFAVAVVKEERGSLSSPRGVRHG